MNINIEKDRVIFSQDNSVAGIYVLNDPFKPYFHPLNTPGGNPVTVASPADHRHHKGMMFSLRCADLNFWEENPERKDCGIQKIKNTRISPNKNGIIQELLWTSIDLEPRYNTYLETREIPCSYKSNKFIWEWKSHRLALRDHELIKSEWSAENKDGKKINYHGLGIRLPWVFIYPDLNTNGLKINGEDTSFDNALGTTPTSVTYWGKLDGKWSPDIAYVTLEQEQDFSLYVMHKEFPFMALGPSNSSNISVKKDDIMNEKYTVTINE